MSNLFLIVAKANDWDPVVKAFHFAASLRSDAAEIFKTKTLSENQWLNFEALSSALELNFGK